MKLWTLSRIRVLHAQEHFPSPRALLTPAPEHRAPVALDVAVDTQEASHIARDAILGIVASQPLVDLSRLFGKRFVPTTLQELMEVSQTALQSGFLGFPSHLEGASTVARAVEGEAQKRQGFSAVPLPGGIPCGEPPAGHQTRLTRL
jgi:hypothetical protein